jgi:hypothetical protein
MWCNPAPANGTQPDLVLAQKDESGRVHLTRAFDSETAEHLNAWLSGFEASMRQRTAFNFDFFMHAIMLIYKEGVEAQIARKGLQLPSDDQDVHERSVGDEEMVQML